MKNLFIFYLQNMKKLLQGLESKNYFQKTALYENAFIKKGLEKNKIQKNDAIRWKKAVRGEKLLLLEYERKKILQKKDFFKNKNKALNFLVNNTKNSNLENGLKAIKFYNIRKQKEKEKAFLLLSSKL